MVDGENLISKIDNLYDEIFKDDKDLFTYSIKTNDNVFGDKVIFIRVDGNDENVAIHMEYSIYLEKLTDNIRTQQPEVYYTIPYLKGRDKVYGKELRDNVYNAIEKNFHLWGHIRDFRDEITNLIRKVEQ